ncbi:MAG: LamB/YcsF family protein [Gemmataceae bacterium]|nr:LamB/YcsF family protein [Gemmataceae bacterium]
MGLTGLIRLIRPIIPLMRIDLNCDLGEGFPHDAELMPLITSANICCAAHAGNEAASRAALSLADKHGVQAGAHPGFADREHFGRRELAFPPDGVRDLCLAQLRVLAALSPVPIAYVKPHGALYNMACRDDALAWPLATLGLPVMGLPGSALERGCRRAGTAFVPEGFADRRYREDGSLVPRDQPGAFIESAEEAVEQAKRLIATRGVKTLCVHGDNPEAVAFVKALRAALLAAGFAIERFTT